MIPGNPPASGSPRSRALARPIPLRVKLLSVLLALVAIALTIISIASVYVLRDYLQGRADRQVTDSFSRSLSELSGQPYIGPPPGGGLGAAFPYVAQIRDQRGQIVTATGLAPPNPGGPDVPTDLGWLGSNAGRLVTVPSLSGTDNWRVITRRVSYQVVDPATGTTSQRTGTLVVGADLGDVNGTIRQLTGIDLIVSGFVVLGLAIVGMVVVRASLRPLTEIERTAEGIAAGDLSRRVPDQDPRTEVGRLGRSLNTMLSQIESAFRLRAESEAAARRSEERLRRFVADASHELRTPLAAIRGFAQYYRQRTGAEGETQHAEERSADSTISASEQDVPAAVTVHGPLPRPDLDWIMQRVDQESARMAGLVEDLLLLARLDQQRPIEHHPVDMLALAVDAVREARIIATDRIIDLTVRMSAAPIVLGDERRLRQVIGNLMSNALRHTPDGTQIDVRLSSVTFDSAPGVALDVIDHGPGIESDQAARVFERFYRTDAARTRKTGGSGLGLSIVSALVAAHGGTVSVDTALGQGATFRVILPLAPTDPVVIP